MPTIEMPRVVEALRRERAMFLDVLRSLDGDDWERPTECPAYDVRGVATHVLGDDLSLLSRQRDGAQNGLARYLDGRDFMGALNHFNDVWVDTVRFLSPAVVVDLLNVVGEWTAAWYEAVDPPSLGEPVGFFGARGPSPYWQIAAREYAERWIHHHQVRRAVHQPGIDDPPLLRLAGDVILSGVAAALRRTERPAGACVELSIPDIGTWHLRRDDAAWVLHSGSAEGAIATLSVPTDRAPDVFSRGVPALELRDLVEATGDSEIRDLFQAFVARP